MFVGLGQLRRNCERCRWRLAGQQQRNRNFDGDDRLYGKGLTQALSKRDAEYGDYRTSTKKPT